MEFLATSPNDSYVSAETLSEHFRQLWRRDTELNKVLTEARVQSDLESIMDGSQSPAIAPIFRIVMTGGPCAGKSTGMLSVGERLRSRGFDVYVVGEAASLLITGGANLTLLQTDQQVIDFQAALLKTQLALEDAFVALAKSTRRPSVILCDRGTMDGSAYMSTELWEEMLRQNDWNQAWLRDDRYEAVMHLVTAADGKPEYYTLANNKARTETPEQAIELDRKLRSAWIGHRALRIIDNSTDFEEKMTRVYQTVAQVVGLPIKSGRITRKKFVLKAVDLSQLLQLKEVQLFDVEQTVLARAGASAEDSSAGAGGSSGHHHPSSDSHALPFGGIEQEWIRKRGQGGVYHYSQTVRKMGPNGSHVELKRHLSHREYLNLMVFRDPDSETLRIKRTCFMYQDQIYVMDSLVDLDLVLIRAQVDPNFQQVNLPPFVTPLMEVTHDKAFSILEMSRQAALKSRG